MSEYVLWGSIFLVTIAVAILALVYLWNRLGKFYIINKLARDSKWKKRLIKLIPMVLLFIYIGTNTVPAIVAVIHLVFFWLIVELISFLLRKVFKVSPQNDRGCYSESNSDDTADSIDDKKLCKLNNKLYIEGVVTLVFTAIYLTFAWVQARNVVQTDYTLTTNKLPTGQVFRVIMMSDSHIGCTFDGEKLGEYINEMGLLSPDAVVIVGDYVDDDSNRKDMINATKAFSEINPTYGTYYVFGNHDVGYGGNRDFNAEDLVAELEKNGVTVMSDDVISLGENVTLIGRLDKSMSGRAEIADLYDSADKSKYSIVLNHQPNDQIKEAAAGVDLVLSGHTHGGQLIPVLRAGEWMGVNDQTSGMLVRDNTTFIVSDGISDWAIPFKTGCKAEYLVIDIVGQ